MNVSLLGCMAEVSAAYQEGGGGGLPTGDVARA